MGKQKEPKNKKNYKLEEVLPFIGENKPKRKFDGDLIGVSSLRMLTFKTKGCSCVQCGIQGKYFRKDWNGNDKPHFNLYAQNEHGHYILMTKDHIQPKSRGGKDILDNMQTMCIKCNNKKGAAWDEQVSMEQDKGVCFQYPPNCS